MQNHPIPLDRILGEADRLRQLAHSILRDVHGAEDVAQEASIIALERAPEGIDERGFRAWISQVTRHLARNRAREVRSRTARERAVARPESMAGSDGSQARVEAQRALAEAVLGLDGETRRLVVMRYFDGLPPREIAERLGSEPAAVSSRLHRALKKLRSDMGARGHGVQALALIARSGAGRRAASSAGLWAASWWLAGAAVAVSAVVLLAVGRTDEPATPNGEVAVGAPSASDQRSDQEVSLLDGAEGSVTPGRKAIDTGAAAATPDEGPAAPESLVLRVAVRDADGKPLRGVTVGPLELPPPGDRWEFAPGRSSVTNGQGEARVTIDWEPDHFQQGRMKGTQAVMLLASLDGWTKGTQREVFREPGEHELETIELQRAGSVRGRVVNEHGEPAKGAFVGAVGPSTPGSEETERLRRDEGQAFARLRHPVRPSFVEDDGTFLLEDVPMGQVSLVAGHMDGPYAYSAPLEVQAGAAAEVGDIVLPDPKGSSPVQLAPPEEPSVVGGPMILRVVTVQGEPLEGARVACMDGVTGAGRVLPSLPESLGRGTFEIAPPDVPFRLVVTATGYETKILGPYDDSMQPQELSVRLNRSVTLTGVVLESSSGRPVEGAHVHGHRPADRDLEQFHAGLLTRWDSNENGVVTATTDANGRFSLALPGRGDRLIHVEHPDFAMAELGPVAIESVGELPGPTIELHTGATLTGQLLVHEWVDPSLFHVVMGRLDGHLRRAPVDAEGTFRFEHLPPGPWQLRRRRGGAPDPGDALDLRTRPVRDPAEPPEFQLTVPREGHVTFDLDYRHEYAVDLDLAVTLDGRWQEGWKVFFSLDCEERYGATDWFWVEETMPASGRVGLRGFGTGEARVTLRRLSTSYGEQSLEHSWPSAPGRIVLEWSVVTGSLEIRSLPVPPDADPGLRQGASTSSPGFALVHASEEGWEWVERFEPTAHGVQRFPQVPAGRIEVRQRMDARSHDVKEWRLIAETEVSLGDTQVLVIP